MLLVLLHDFPEFLCDYHFSFCDVIPPNCIQMRNLILSAFPRNMRLPDPFTPNLKVLSMINTSTINPHTSHVTLSTFLPQLKVEMLPDIAHAPRILPTYTQHIQGNLKKVRLLIEFWFYSYCHFQIILLQDLDNYIRTRAPVTFLQELRGHLTVCFTLWYNF